MLKKRYLFLIIVCLFAISAVSAEEISNETNMIVNENEDTLEDSLIDDEIVVEDDTFEALQEKINNAPENSTITLKEDYFNTGNELEITIGKNITIDGKNHIIDANHASRIFNIVESNVILKNINFVNGHIKYGTAISDQTGGAIYCNACDINVIDCNFMNNTARYSGGAIYDNSESIIDNCDFINNSALYTGALYIANSSTVRNCDFMHNVGKYSAGAIYNFHGNNTVSDCNFIGNSNSTIDFSTELSRNSVRTNLTYSNLNMDKNNDYTNAISIEDNCLSINGYYIDFDYEGDIVTDILEFYISGSVLVDISGKKYEGNFDNEGKTKIKLDGLSSGVHDAKISYSGDENFGAFDINLPVTIESPIHICVDNVTKYYGDSERLTIKVIDESGYELKGIPLLIIINGEEYEKTTGDDGSTSVGLNLPANNYTAEIIFKGNEKYPTVNTTSNINIKTTIIGFDVEKIEKSSEPYVATFLDSTGKYLPQGEYMRFNINGVFYDRVIRENGQAKLNLNLEAKTYIITAYNTITGEESSNSITIKPRIVNNSDVTKFYRNRTQYYVTLLDDNGNPVKANETVTFNINGVFYERKTNENGTAKLNINLEPKTYIITAEYKNCRVSNTIKVLPVLSAKDLTMKYKDGSQFKANLVDSEGKAYTNQTITFNVNGVFYYRITDINGTVNLNINLMAGKYIITSSYNGSNIANTITINS